MHETQFQEEADSVSQTLAKLNSSLDIQYSPAPGEPPANPTELLLQLEVRLPRPASVPLSWEGDLPMCLGLTTPQVPSPTLSPSLGGQEKGVTPAEGGWSVTSKLLPSLDLKFPRLSCDRASRIAPRPLGSHSRGLGDAGWPPSTPSHRPKGPGSPGRGFFSFADLETLTL